MNPRVNQISSRKFFTSFTFVLLFALLCLMFLAPPDGAERAQVLQFVGRFHPLSVHLPIAILVLVPLLELAGRSRRFSYLLAAVNFLLAVGICGTIGAATLGWCLARSGAYAGPIVVQHMWGGVSAAAATWFCWVLRNRESVVWRQRHYAFTLALSLGLVSFTGYRGGQLAHGENHLTENMPANLHSLFGLVSPAPIDSNLANRGPATFYGERIQPVLEAHCVTCHGQNKHKAGLRLDSYESVMHGSKRGPVIKPGEPKTSELFHRITLPPADDDFMPAEHKRPLSASDVKIIELWILTGASGTQSAGILKDLPEGSRNQAEVAEVSFDEPDPAAVARDRAGFASVISQLQRRLPNILDYESRSSADVVITASLMGPAFGDDELAELSALSERIVFADFSATAITDRSAHTLASMKRLRVLRLMHTKITDTTLAALGSLDQLQSLSLFDTAVTQAALPAISSLPKLRHVYVRGTKITENSSLPAEMRSKLVF
jgi:uncharacterized membrane protein